MVDFILKRGYKFFIIFLFALGILLRLYLYLQNSSLWFDEAGLAINFFTKSYKGLLGGLDYLQAAPAGFCLMVKALIDIFHFDNDFYKDYLIRIVPFLSGVLTLPAFFYLINLVFKDKVKILFSFALFALNAHSIIYSSQCKQYETELLCAVILITLFLKIIRGEYKWFYSFLISIVPWFSYSSFFIIAAGMLGVLVKKRYREFLYCIIPLVLSCVAYYFLSLKDVFLINYSGMDQVWVNFKAFLDFHHPIRLFLRFGEIFVSNKVLAIFSGCIIFYSLCNFCFSKRDFSEKVLFCLPVLILIIASLLHKYPVYSRLILFTLPVFVIVIADLKGYFNNILKFTLVLLVIYALFSTTVYAKEMAYSYARDVIIYLQKNIQEKDSIIMDNDANEFYYYMIGKSIDNKIYKMPVTCIKCNVDMCKDYINSLPNGDYYFLSSHDNVVDVAKDYKMYDLPFKPKYVKAVYFKKGDWVSESR